MPTTLMYPPVKIGYPTADNSQEGSLVAGQVGAIAQNSTAAVTITFILPRCRILGILFDTITAWDSAVSATGSAGTAAGGTQYASGVDVKTAGRARPAFTGPQLALFNLTGKENTVYVTITPNGATSAGNTRIMITYLPI